MARDPSDLVVLVDGVEPTTSASGGYARRPFLPYNRAWNMVIHIMKTTLVIDDTVMQRLREEARKRGVTMSQLVEAGLRLVLDEPATHPEVPPPLPRWHSGGARVDVADRDALYALLDRD